MRNFLNLRLTTAGLRAKSRTALAAGLLALALMVICSTAISRAAADQPVEKQTGGEVVELKLEGEVAPILANYIDEGLADAAQRHAALVLITMDTPGGLTDSMKDIIQHILASPVPVAVYVSPTGARGASAGFYILLSADVAAMAPGTHTGAASPVIMIGGYVPPIDETLRKKINNDAMAFLRSFSERRGRNPVLAETAITDAKAFTEKEALDSKMIDLVAVSKEDLLRQLNGKAITRFDGTKVTLALEHPTIQPFELSQRQKFLALIVSPDAFFILLTGGGAGVARGVHASWCGGSGGGWRDRRDPGALRHASAAGELRWVIFDPAGTGVSCSGGEVRQSRSPGDRRDDRHRARSDVPDSIAADQWRRESFSGAGGDAAVCTTDGIPDASGVALAKMEIRDRH